MRGIDAAYRLAEGCERTQFARYLRHFVLRQRARCPTRTSRGEKGLQAIAEIYCDKSPREVLEEDFKSLSGGIPISGGWGYTKGDPCIIDRDDPAVNGFTSFNGVAIEYLFVEKRIYEELIIFRPEDDRFSGITWNLVSQGVIREGERVYDHLVFDIRCFCDRDWNELKAEYDGATGLAHPEFNLEEHAAKRKQKELQFTREFWFDITSFFGQ